MGSVFGGVVYDAVKEKSDYPENPTSIYDFNVLDIKGENVSLKKYQGKVLLIVNIADDSKYTK
jgi:glutathione peroxidase